MGGGLIHVATYASNDLYLTGAPQITFYKMMYRRYTNFAMESVYLNFDDDIKFDYESELVPPRVGDLIHKAYLHINIPNMSISKTDVGIDTSDIQYSYLNKSIVSDYEKVKSVYMNVMANIYRISYKAANAINVSYVGLLQDVQTYVSSNNVLTLINDYDALLLETQQNLQSVGDPRAAIMDSNLSDLWYIITHINISTLIANATKQIDPNVFEPNSDAYVKELQRIMKTLVLKELERGLYYCTQVQQYFFDESNKFINQTATDKSQNIKCAWVKNLGHSIIEYVDIYIGGKKIDRHLGIWINIWYQLTYKEPQIEIYNSMIGNVAALTNFDNQEKPSYDIFVPLTFWFSKFNGLSFPLIAMQYNDIRFSVKLRKFEQVFFIERLYKGSLNGSDITLTAELIDFIQNRSENQASLSLTNIEMVNDIVLSDIFDNKGKKLNGHILLDYVYLSSPERKLFAQSGHEYLIEVMQTLTFDNVQQINFDARLDFTTPCKELIWVFLKDIYTQNPSGWNPCRWYDFSVSDGTGNPVIDASIGFNSYTRVLKQVGMYFDVYQPYVYHHVSPSRGINLYSFCLEPLQHQPTGSCNFSRISDARLFTTIDDMLYRFTDAQIYPYDLTIDFTFNITEPAALLESIDIEYVKKIIRQFTLATNNVSNPNILDGRVLTSVQLKLYQDANATLFVYNQLSAGKSIQIQMSSYRRLILKTTATCYIFDLTMNILRLIGGYGALAYAGNN
jgi:hypothetical protein